MKGIGSTLLFFGFGSAVLYFTDYEFIILSWVDTWGPTVGWIIRGAMIALGGALYLFGGSAEEEEPETE